MLDALFPALGRRAPPSTAAETSRPSSAAARRRGGRRRGDRSRCSRRRAARRTSANAASATRTRARRRRRCCSRALADAVAAGGRSGDGHARDSRRPHRTAGSPGSGSGGCCGVDADRPSTRRPRHRAASLDPAHERSRLEAALETAAGDLETLAHELPSAPARRSARSSRPRRSSHATPGSWSPRWRPSPAVRPQPTRSRSAPTTGGTPGGRRRRVLPRARRRRPRRRASGRQRLRGEPGRTSGMRMAGRRSIVADDLDPSAVATLRPELVAGIALAAAPRRATQRSSRAGSDSRSCWVWDRRRRVLPDGLEALVDGGDGPSRDRTDDRTECRRSRDRGPTSRRRSARPATCRCAATANVGSVLEAEAAVRPRRGRDRSRPDRAPVPGSDRPRPPSMAEQRNLYARITEAMGDRPVVFRHTRRRRRQARRRGSPDRPEANPALGVRGVQQPLGLARPALLDDQLRAPSASCPRGEVGRIPECAKQEKTGSSIFCE